MEFFEQFILINTFTKFIAIVFVFGLASILYRFSYRFAGWLLRFAKAEPSYQTSTEDGMGENGAMPRNWLAFNSWWPAELRLLPQLRRERQRTLQQLLSSVLNLVIFGTAVAISLSMFADATTVVWLLGFFGTAIAFAGRAFVGDILSGLSIIFQDKVVVGEKVQLVSQLEIIEGTVEYVNLRTTFLRARTGELYIVGNEELRFLCNFTRGPFSSTTITVKIAASHFIEALSLLKALGQEAANLFPELREPWLVLSETGAMDENIELTLAIKTYFGQAATLRPRLMAFIQSHLAQAEIPLAK